MYLFFFGSIALTGLQKLAHQDFQQHVGSLLSTGSTLVSHNLAQSSRLCQPFVRLTAVMCWPHRLQKRLFGFCGECLDRRIDGVRQVDTFATFSNPARASLVQASASGPEKHQEIHFFFVGGRSTFWVRARHVLHVR